MYIKLDRKIKQRTFIDMVPMVDIIFQLVIFFMLATTFKTTTGLELDLPDSKYLTTISTTPLKITIADENRIFVGNVETDIDNLQNIIKKEVIKDTSMKQSVVIYGNKDIKYQLLIDILDILRMEGYESIDLALKKKIYEYK